MRRLSTALFVTLAVWLPVSAALAETQAAVTRTSRPVRLLRSWEETIKARGGREYPRRVEVVFDYARGIARENYYTKDGRLYGSRRITQNMPRPSVEEVAEALELVRSDAHFSPYFARFPEAMIEGGFVLEERRGRPCGPGHRCLQFQLRSSYYGALLHRIVVDLGKETIAYRNHVASRTGAK